MKRILITGGTGFIGRNLKEAFSKKYQIFSPSHSDLDLLDFETLKKYIARNKIDVIVHAAIHVPIFNGTEKEFFNDMKMFLNLEKIGNTVEKIIYFGSGAEYDKRYDIRMVREDEIGRSIPASEYGLAKYTMNLLAKESINIYNLRLFGIFGKYELWQIKFLSNLCCKAIYDLPLSIRKNCYFDFLYIEDLPGIVSWFIDNKPTWHDYNVCMGRQYLLSELAEMIRKVSGKQLPVIILDKGKNPDYSANNDRLRCDIKDLHITSMEDALIHLYNYYLENKNIINFETLKESK